MRSRNLLVGVSLSALVMAAQAMHPSWDTDKDGINDCEADGSCDHTVDYSKPKPAYTAPSYNCEQKNLSSVEVLICNNSLLAAKDLALHERYKQLTTTVTDDAFARYVKVTQRGWIKGRNECWKSEPVDVCVNNEYAARMAKLDTLFRHYHEAPVVKLSCDTEPQVHYWFRRYNTDPLTATVSSEGASWLLYRETAEDSPSSEEYRGPDASLTVASNMYKLTLPETEVPLRCVAEDNYR